MPVRKELAQLFKILSINHAQGGDTLASGCNIKLIQGFKCRIVAHSQVLKGVFKLSREFLNSGIHHLSNEMLNICSTLETSVVLNHQLLLEVTPLIHEHTFNFQSFNH